MRIIHLVGVLAALVVLSASMDWAAVPSQFTVQGRLTAAAGTPLPEGEVTLIFRIYDAQTVGTLVWPGVGGESQTVKIDATGSWSANLGVVIPLTDAVFAGAGRWLEITVDDGVGTETLPRIQILTVPYAFRVATVDSATGGTITDKVTIGSTNSNNGTASFVAGERNVLWGEWSTIAGGYEDSVYADYAFIGGGERNTAREYYTTVAGGSENAALGYASAVGGGRENTASASNSVVGGGFGNGAKGANSTVAGGEENAAMGNWSFVGGGQGNTAGINSHATVAGGNLNTASGERATVGGGYNNNATGDDATIGGGNNNTAQGDFAVVAGGLGNTVSDTGACGGGAFNLVVGDGATVAGGIYNKAYGQFSVVSGGGGRETDSNVAISGWSVVAGGRQNRAGQPYYEYATVSGGAHNVARGEWSTVGGGSGNEAAGSSATIAGGGNNSAYGQSATVGGGATNHAGGDFAAIGGGGLNTANGNFGTVPGGYDNAATGLYSFAAGRNAKAVHDGAFVWGDNQAADVSSDNTDQFKIRAQNGVHLASEAGDAKYVGYGELYSDNAIVAWGRVAGASGALSGNEFNVFTVTHDSVGAYTISIFASAESAAELIPVVTLEVESIPRSAGTARHWYINQTSTNTFEVYITNGNYGSVDNDFVFIVTGRD